MKSRLILASASPRRKTLLQQAGFDFDIIVPQIKEIIQAQWSPEKCVQELAYQKAQDVIAQLRQPENSHLNRIILAADTIVAIADEILGKPRDVADAYQMLWRLSRTRHRVLTGICLWPLSWQRGITALATTYIEMRPMSVQEIQDYIASGEAMGKAGAYAIQESADRFIRHIDGDFDNVVGLPIKLVRQVLEQLYFFPAPKIENENMQQ